MSESTESRHTGGQTRGDEEHWRQKDKVRYMVTTDHRVIRI